MFTERSDPLRELCSCRPTSSRIGFTGPNPSSSLLSEATDTDDRSTLRRESDQCYEVVPPSANCCKSSPIISPTPRYPSSLQYPALSRPLALIFAL